jgi:prepilin-type N-terminal cleavage/methylation domain-containing protein
MWIFGIISSLLLGDIPGMDVIEKRGYSIIELLITFVIIGIVVSFAIPGFSRWLPNYYLKTAVTDLYSSLHLAKMNAVRDNAEWALYFSPSFRLYQIRVGTGPDGEYSDPGGYTVEKTIWLDDYKGGVGYGHGSASEDIAGGSAWGDEITFGNNTVVFSPRGMADDEGYVYLQNKKNITYAVGALTTGLVLMRKWAGAAWE